MTKSCDVAIVGVYGIAGDSLMSLLEEHEHPFDRVHLLETENAAGGRLMLKGESQRVEVVQRFDFSKVKVVIFISEAALAAEWAPVAVEAGCVVIDASGAYRQDDIPLVVAEVNAHAIAGYKQHGIIACPDAQTVQSVMALKPLQVEAGLQAVTVATYQSMSTCGQEEVEGLALQTGRLLNGQPAERGPFDKQAAFNLIPRIGEMDEQGYTPSEKRLAADIRRVLEMPQLPVSVTCVVVPVFFGTAQVMQATTDKPVTAKRLPTVMRKAPGIKLLDKASEGGYPTPVTDATGSDNVWIGRLRQDEFNNKSVNMWIVSDNLRKGVALNSLLVAGLLIKDYL